MNQKRWFVMPLFVLWCPVALFYGVMNIIVLLLAKGAYRVNKGLWKLEKLMSDFPVPVARFFGDSIIFAKYREKQKQKHKDYLEKHFNSVGR